MSKGKIALYPGIFLRGDCEPLFALQHFSDLSASERISLLCMYGLNLFLILGYGLITVHLATVEVPMLVRKLDQHVDEALEDLDGDRNAPSLKNPSAFSNMAIGRSSREITPVFFH